MEDVVFFHCFNKMNYSILKLKMLYFSYYDVNETISHILFISLF